MKVAELKKADLLVGTKKAHAVTKAQGEVSYKKISGNSKKTTVLREGKIKDRQGLKKGTYEPNVKVTAAGNERYRLGSKTATVKISAVRTIV